MDSKESKFLTFQQIVQESKDLHQRKYVIFLKEELKARKMPFEGYSSSISDIIDSLDKKEQQFRESYPRAKRSINTRQHEYLEK